MTVKVHTDEAHFADQAEEADLVVTTLDLLCPNAPVAVSALQLEGRMEYRYFDRHADAAAWVHRLPTVKAVYAVLNPYAKTSAGPGIAATDITQRRWLLIDCDPVARSGRTPLTGRSGSRATPYGASWRPYVGSVK